MKSMADTDLGKALKECQNSAKEGFQIASTQEKILSKTLESAQDNVNRVIMDFNTSSCYSPGTAELLESQLVEVNKTLNRMSFVFQEDLNRLKENLYKFSITLFGRTMAGKSTLMEILTEGNGSSIGKGAQRTTRDVRTYKWNGLEITDLPGIGAFGGEEDEQIAFNAAKTADLILFLITDDAPQAVDAECFSKIVELGKPIIGIMNVKKAIREDKSLRFTSKEINKQFDLDRLNKIKNQFYQFSEQYGQTWASIPFVYVHLQSAFMAQNTADENTRNCYHELSRIDCLKSQIIEAVVGKGRFYRIKNFVDIIANPLLESTESLLEQSKLNYIQGRTLKDKKRQLDEWKELFYRDGKAQINSLIVKIRSDLNGEIASFAEDHFEDKNADKAWSKILESRRVEIRCQELLEELESKSNDKLREVSREIINELKYVTSIARDKSLRMHRIINAKQLSDWSVVIGGGGLTITTLLYDILPFAKPLRWAALAVSGIGFLGAHIFSNREQKEYEARIKLESSLRENVIKNCALLQSQMERNLDTLVSKKIGGLLGELDKVSTVITDLADTQKELARGLNEHLLEINCQLMTEAIWLIDAKGLEYHVQKVARIPGNTSLFLLHDGSVFPQKQHDDLCELMSEEIGFVYNSDNDKTLISHVLGGEIDIEKISIEEKTGVVHVSLQDASPRLKNRARLAQQFSELLIVDQ